MREYYRIINPSDRVHIASDNELAACVAVALISNGDYGLRRCHDGREVMPIMGFDPSGRVSDWWLADPGIPNTGEALDAFIEANRIAMADALDSVFYGSVEEMQAFELANAGVGFGAFIANKAEHNDRKRSSMNNIEAAALAYAVKLRRLEADQ